MRGAFDDQYGAAEPVTPQPVEIKPALGEPQPYPVDAMGRKMQRAVHALVKIVQIPAAIAAQSVLGACALVAQPRVNIELPTKEIVPSNLFLKTIAVSGDRKSTADKLALKPIYEKEAQLREKYDEEQGRYSAELAAYNVSLAQAKRAGTKTRDQIRDDILRCGTPPPAPALPLLLVEEPTIEGMTKLLDEAYPFIGLFSDEGARMLGGYALKDENQAATGAALSQLWDGKTIKRVRGTDATKFLPGRRCSIHLMLQPSVALAFFANKALRGQGLMSRLLCSYPTSIKGQRLWREPEPQDWADMEAYWQLLGLRTAEAFHKLDAVTRLPTYEIVRLTPEARETWIKFSDHIEKQQAQGQPLEEIADLASKAAQHAARLAVVMAYFENGADLLVRDGLSAGAMAAGIRLTEYYLGEGLRLYNGGTLDAESENAAALIDFIRKKGFKTVGRRWLAQSGPKQVRPALALNRAIEILVDEGHLVEIKGGAQVEATGKFEKSAYTVIGIEA